MDRFFNKLESGKVVQRHKCVRSVSDLSHPRLTAPSSWTITAHQSMPTISNVFPRSCLLTICVFLPDLFSPKGLKLRQDNDDREAPREDKQTQIAQELAPDCALRVERQTLHRFPKSKAILFGVHTCVDRFPSNAIFTHPVFLFIRYLYPLKDIKAEGQGEALATAVEGLFPEMGFFKS